MATALVLVAALLVVSTAAAASSKPTIQTLSPESGPTAGGTTVTITGRNFGDGGVTSVTFGGVPATSFVVDSDTQIRAVSPAAAAAGGVPLTVQGGGGTHSKTFTYTAPSPTPTTTSPSPTTSTTPSPTTTTPTTSTTTPPSPTTTSPAPTSTTPTTTNPSPTTSPSDSTSPTPSATTDSPTPTPSSTTEASPTPSSATTTPVSAAPTTAPPVVIVQAPQPTASLVAPVWQAPPVSPNAAPAAPTHDSACSVSIAPTAPGERLVVPFPSRCGFASVVVDLPASSGALNLTVRRLSSLPLTVPLPETDTAPALIFEAELYDANGTAVQPESAVLQVRISSEWLETCPEDRCRPELLHYHDGKWRRHQLQLVDEFNGTAVMQGITNGFSVFAVAGVHKSVWAEFALTAWSWVAVPLLGTVAAGASLVRHRRSTTHRARVAVESALAQDVQDKVARLLQETKDKEELLQFVNNAAHDLANPLTPIKIQLDLMSMAADATQDPTHKKSLAILGRSVDQIGRLINDLRDASKLQAGKLRFAMERVDLASVVRETFEAYHAQAAQGRVELTIDAAESLPVNADAGRVAQILTNFLNNALKFTPEGGSVHLQAFREGAETMVLVRDSGLGMTAQDQALLFRPFSQAHGDAQKKKGTGLGLYISKRIVDAHQGRIGCISDGPGTGSTFWFSLPLASEASPRPADSDDTLAVRE